MIGAQVLKHLPGARKAREEGEKKMSGEERLPGTKVKSRGKEARGDDPIN